MVEIVLEVEDRFGISIPDREAEKMVTVGALHAFVCRAIGAVDVDSGCLSRSAFYSLRHNLASLGVGRRHVRRKAHVEDLLPSQTRRAAWRQLTQRWSPALPPLEFSRKVADPFCLSVSILLLMSVVFIGVAWDDGNRTEVLIGLSGIAIGSIGAALVVRIARPWARTVPDRWRSIEDLVNLHVGESLASLDRPPARWTKQLVFYELQSIITEVCGVRRHAVTMDARFVEDLGAG